MDAFVTEVIHFTAILVYVAFRHLRRPPLDDVDARHHRRPPLDDADAEHHRKPEYRFFDGIALKSNWGAWGVSPIEEHSSLIA
jgi:hypothetical protein